VSFIYLHGRSIKLQLIAAIIPCHTATATLPARIWVPEYGYRWPLDVSV
jgi:hypothetical protein